MLKKITLLFCLLSLTGFCGYIQTPAPTTIVYSPASDFTYTTNNNEITITGYVGAGGTVSIPPTINGFPVKEIGDRAFSPGYAGIQNLIEVRLPLTVVSLARYAFCNCANLSAINLDAGMQSIGEGTFQSCTSLPEELVLSKSLLSLADGAFYYCTGVKQFKFKWNAPSIFASSFVGCNATIYRTREATGFGLPPSLFGGLPTAYWDPSPRQGTVISKAVSKPVMGDASLQQGLVLHYKFDEASWNGTAGEVIDASGNGNNGTSYNGAQTNPGKLGRAGQFDGMNDYVTSLTSDAGDVTNNFTVILWIKATVQGGRLVCKRDYSATQYDFQLQSNGRLGIYDGVSSIGDYVSLPNDYDWHQVGFSSVDGALFFHRDGQTTFNLQTAVFSHRDINLGIGSFPVGVIDPFKGAIDDVRIYNRALTSNEVVRLYNMTSVDHKANAVYQGNKLVSNPRGVGYVNNIYPNVTNGLVAWWKMDELSWDGTAGGVKDSIGSYNGTAVNSPITNPGKIGRAGSFDGSQSITFSATEITNAISVSFWAKRADSGSLCSPLQFGDMLIRMDYGSFNFWPNVNAPNAVFSTPAATTDWLHYTVTHLGVRSTLYTNGIFFGEADTTELVYSSGWKNFGSIGNYLGSAFYFKGFLDDVRIYNRALSSNEVQTIHQWRP